MVVCSGRPCRGVMASVMPGGRVRTDAEQDAAHATVTQLPRYVLMQCELLLQLSVP
jgi:hypothetical protein